MRIETTLMTNICYDVFYAEQYLAFTLNLFFCDGGDILGNFWIDTKLVGLRFPRRDLNLSVTYLENFICLIPSKRNLHSDFDVALLSYKSN